MTENALSILSVIFSVQLEQTEISERKLFIFHLGCQGLSMPKVKLDTLTMGICNIDQFFSTLQCCYHGYPQEPC